MKKYKVHTKVKNFLRLSSSISVDGIRVIFGDILYCCIKGNRSKAKKEREEISTELKVVLSEEKKEQFSGHVAPFNNPFSLSFGPSNLNG